MGFVPEIKYLVSCILYKDKLIHLMTTSFIDIKFYIVHCLFMVVLVEAKIN